MIIKKINLSNGFFSIIKIEDINKHSIILKYKPPLLTITFKELEKRRYINIPIKYPLNNILYV